MSQMFEEILLVCDDQYTCENTLKQGCDLISKLNVPATVLFIQTDRKGGVNLSEAKAYIDNYATTKRLSITIEQQAGDMNDVVLKACAAKQYSLIIMNIRTGSSGILGTRGKMLLLLQEVNCPVLNLPSTSEPLNFKHIMLPLLDHRTTRQTVPFCTEIAKLFGSTIHIYGVTAYKGDETTKRIKSYVRQTERFFAQKGLKYTSSIDIGVKVKKSCIAYSNVNAISVMFFSTHSEDPGFLKPAYLEQILGDTEVPVISVNPKDTRIAGAAGY
ncbi:MAG: hypothetical protein ABF321_00665 [Bacteroidia bacterium]